MGGPKSGILTIAISTLQYTQVEKHNVWQTTSVIEIRFLVTDSHCVLIAAGTTGDYRFHQFALGLTERFFSFYRPPRHAVRQPSAEDELRRQQELVHALNCEVHQPSDFFVRAPLAVSIASIEPQRLRILALNSISRE